MRISDWSSDVCSSDLAGQYGGTLSMVMGRDKDSRMMVVYGYARLVTYRPGSFELAPDLVASVAVQDDRVFTFTLREGHRWSRSEEHTSELQSLMRISYAVVCLTQKNVYTTTAQT